MASEARVHASKRPSDMAEAGPQVATAPLVILHVQLSSLEFKDLRRCFLGQVS